MIRLKKFGTISCEKISSYCSLCNFVFFFFLLFLSLLGYRVQLLFHAAFNSCNIASRVSYIISPNNTVDITILIMHKILFSSINAMFRVSTLRVSFSLFFLFFFLFIVRNPSELPTRSSIMKFTKSVRAIRSLESDTVHRTFLKSYEEFFLEQIRFSYKL